MDLWLAIVLIVVIAAACGGAAFFAGINHRKKIAEAAIGSAEAEAKKIVSEALKTAEAKKKEIILEGKDETHRLRNESEKELAERRREVQRQERRIQSKEETLDKKLENLEIKEEKVQKRLKAADEKFEEAEMVKKSQFEMLERISGYTAEQAKSYLLNELESQLTHEKAVRILEYEQQLKDESEQKARNIISLAIQRCAADHVAEATVSVVPLPNDEMKGRIIGREGRNIRTIETLTGVDLIIDDTPEAITLSSFEPVRREIARVALEKLISDGRIHPARIEETVEKARREVEATIKKEGERAVIEAGVNGIHPELIKLLGRLRYRTSYGQNVLNHSLEVSYLRASWQASLAWIPLLPKGPVCCMTLVKPLTTKLKALISKSAWMSQKNIRKAKPLFMRSMRTTAISRPKRSLPALYRLQTLFPLQGPVHGVKIWKTILNVCKSWKRSRLRLTVWKTALPSRPGVRSALW